MDIMKVLFVCVHNSARSQMAEAFLNKYGGGKFVAESAGSRAGKLNPIVVQAMSEIGIDISRNETKSVLEFFKQGRRYSYVITVCDESNSEKCPIFPGALKTLHWSFNDPSVLTGSREEKLAGTRIIRDEISTRVQQWVKELAADQVVVR